LIQSDKVATLDISTPDFTSPSFYPHHLDTSNQQLVHGFISSNRVADFISQFKLKIVQKLLPGLQKEGYIEEFTTTTSSSSTPQSQDQRNPRPQPLNPPDAPESRIYPRSALPRNPLEIGRRDLDPFPLSPFAPPSMFPPHGGDGMFVGPDHPIFGGGARGPFADRGPWGGDGFLPPLGAPPGARFDPVGPRPRPLGGNNGRLPGRGNMHDPDNDDFMPPGVVSRSSK
jgi:proteasome inhibitor subunit 1 (PI31)